MLVDPGAKISYSLGKLPGPISTKDLNSIAAATNLYPTFRRCS